MHFRLIAIENLAKASITSSAALLCFSQSFSRFPRATAEISFSFLSLISLPFTVRRSQCLKFIKSLGLGNEIFILVPTVGSPGSVSLPISFARALLDSQSRREITNHSFAITRQCNIAQKHLSTLHPTAS
jgi:hypothetical protein